MHLLVRRASDRAARVFFGGVASSKPAVPTTATTGLLTARHNEASLRAGTRKLKQPGVNAASVGAIQAKNFRGHQHGLRGLVQEPRGIAV